MTAKPDRRRVNLALQGGGAHGAFTWGVLDRLLEDGRLAIDGISGTSAGAMNAAALADGLAKEGVDGARASLTAFWQAIAGETTFNPLSGLPFQDAFRAWNANWWSNYSAVDVVSRFVSPYQFNPLNLNPLRDVLDRSIDFAALRENSPVKLFISTTNVRTGKIKVFETAEITTQVLLASACLPNLFQAVEVAGEYYWDGGYMGNPAIFPLIYGCDSQDVIVVGINPLEVEDVPHDAPGIMERLNDISFNSTLMREMRAIAFVSKLVEEGAVDSRRYKRLNIHYIDGGALLAGFGAESKYNTDRAFLKRLFGLGRDSATEWLDAHFDAVGVRSSIDVRARFL